MALAKLLHRAKQELQGFVLKPYQESLWILADILNLSPGEIYLDKKNISEDQKKLF